MGNSVLIKELATGQITDSLYLVADRSVRAHKNKPGQYLQLQLQDRTGSIKAMYWDVPGDVAAAVHSGGVYQVQGKVENYQDDLQIRVTAIREPKGQVDWSQFLPESRRSARELQTEFDRVVTLIQDPDYQALVKLVRGDERLWARYAQAPAATSVHHAYLRGLLEHTLNMCRLCEALKPIYPDANLDLLLTGAIFHDAGKVYEYESGPAFNKTIYGELVGHLAIGDQMVVQLATKVEGMAKEKVWHLRHLVLSHHGQLEFGAPVLPKTLEGLLLHFADNIDAKVGTYRQAADSTPEGETLTDRVWSMDHRRFVLTGDGRSTPAADFGSQG
jgi:3'-5' exoribonuclease